MTRDREGSPEWVISLIAPPEVIVVVVLLHSRLPEPLQSRDQLSVNLMGLLLSLAYGSRPTIADRGLDSSCNKGLAPTLAGSFHGPRNKPSKAWLESLDQALHGDALISSIGCSEPNRLCLQSGSTEINKMFRVKTVIRTPETCTVGLLFRT